MVEEILGFFSTGIYSVDVYSCLGNSLLSVETLRRMCYFHISNRLKNSHQADDSDNFRLNFASFQSRT